MKIKKSRSNRRRPILGLVAIGLLILFLPAAYFITRHPKIVEAQWFDDSWQYRNIVPVTNNTTVQTNVYVAVTIDTSTASQFQNDCGDLRWTDFNGKTLQYYIVSGCTSVSTVVHVLLPTFPAGTQNLYYYYGNPSAANGFASADFSTQATSYSVGSTGSQEVGKGPIAYWKLDEGSGNANDSTPNAKTGTVSGASWQPEDQCVSGKCLKFDGVSNNVTVTGTVYPSTTETVSLWAKWNNPTLYQTVFETGNATTGFAITLYTGGYIAVVYNNVDWVVTTTIPNSNQWYQITLVRDSSQADPNKNKIYINGQEATYSYRTVSLGNTATGSTRIGFGIGSAAGYLQGFADEVKIYGYVRTAAQIQTDYSSRGTVKGASINFGSTINPSLNNGLVGYWKMDENTGGTTADATGNGGTGTLTNNTWATGIFGSATSFTGTGSVSIPNSTPLTPNYITVSMWIKPTSFANSYNALWGKETIGSPYGSAMLVRSTGKMAVYVRDNAATDYHYDNTGSHTLTAGNWYNVAFTYDGNRVIGYVNGEVDGTVTTAGNPLAVVSAATLLADSIYASRKFSGSIDEVRIYNRALTQNEITQLYNFAPSPIAYYNFDDGTGSSVTDRSGNNNTGTWNGTSSHWVEGKFSKAGFFDSTQNDYVGTGIASAQPKAFSIGAWINLTNTAAGEHGIISKYTSTFQSGSWTLEMVGNQLLWDIDDGAQQACYYSGTLSPNTWYYVSGTFDGSLGTLYVNGSKACTINVGALANLSDEIQIGSALTGKFNGIIDEVRIYNYARSARQVVEDMNAGHPIGGSPVGSQLAYWKFDEGFGQTAHNSGSLSSIADATLGSTGGADANDPSWTPSGRFGRGLNFNGSSQYLVVPSTSTISIGGDMTISAWFRTSYVGEAPILSNRKTVGSLYFGILSGKAFVYYNPATPPGISSVKSINDNAWHQFTYVRTGTTTNFYIDGKLDTSTTQTGYTTTLDEIQIGHDVANAVEYFPGQIDEVKIYGGALTADQVKIDYDQGQSLVLGALSDTSGLTGGTIASNSASAIYCVPGDSVSCNPPVGEWNFDEGQGTVVNDTSGNGNSGNWTGTGSHWTIGKFGKAGSFNGTSDVVTITDPTIADFGAGQDFSIEFWVNQASFAVTPNIAKKTYTDNSTGWVIGGLGDGSYQLKLGNGATNIGVITSVTSANTWNHITYTVSRAGNCLAYVNGKLTTTTSCSSFSAVDFSNANNLLFGEDMAGSFSAGNLDQIRIFNYVRTPSQIAWDYNQGKPVGWWKLDECQGTTVSDSAGSGITGTIVTPNGAGSTQDAAGTCTDGISSHAWWNGRTGKYNYSLNFDGVDDYVTITNPSIDDFGTGPMSASVWIKTSSVPVANGIGTIVDNKIAGTNSAGFNLQLDTNGRAYFRVANGSSQNTSGTATQVLTDGNWHHLTGTLTRNGGGDTLSLYIDGRLATSNVITAGWNITSSTNLLFGAYSTGITNGNFQGQIDDVRLFNYNLTSSQVKQLFNQGSALRFDPVTGTP